MNKSAVNAGVQTLRARYGERVGIVDRAAAEMWINFFASSPGDETSMVEACNTWIASNPHPPTLKELSDVIRHRHRQNNPINPRTMCDGTGWVDRGSGLEPCPSCNPWQRSQWEAGTWTDGFRLRPPAAYVMPGRCRPLGERVVSVVDGRRVALAALEAVGPVSGWAVETISGVGKDQNG